MTKKIKQLTKEEVMNALIDHASCEPDDWGGVIYYIYITQILNSWDGADEIFKTRLNPDAYEGKDYDWRDEVEVEDNEYFLEVVENLTNQANEYLKKCEQDD